MLFADKLIQLRKQHGYSQEELAQKMNISRQSISKWEQGQSVPDIEKIIQLSEIFQVSIDSLLKDSIPNQNEDTIDPIQEEIKNVAEETIDDFIEVEEDTMETKDTNTTFPYLTLEETKQFIELNKQLGKMRSNTIFIMILSMIIPVVFLYSSLGIQMVFIGIIIMLVLCFIAFYWLISTTKKMHPYSYILLGKFQLNDTLKKQIQEQQNEFYAQNPIYHSILFIFLYFLFIFATSILKFLFPFLFLLSTVCTLLFTAIGVRYYINAKHQDNAYKILLKTKKSYSNTNLFTFFSNFNSMNSFSNIFLIGFIVMSYWLIVTAFYLGVSFLFHIWNISWIIWIIAGLLFPIVLFSSIFYIKKRNYNQK